MTFLAVPNYGSIHPATMFSVMNASQYPTEIHARTSSFLIDSFNDAWCRFLDSEAKYFAMIHADIGTDPLWIDDLIKEMEEEKLEVLSSVIAIKDNSAQTSTGVLREKKIHRLSFSDTKELPQTFTSNTLNGTLLINTGLWVATRSAWMEEFPGFSVASKIIVQDGKHSTVPLPEDWSFSLWLHSKQIPYGATTLLPTDHYGLTSFTYAH